MTKVKLFCLPFAGGNKYSYRALKKCADPEKLEWISLELPGRGARFKEYLLTGLEAMAEDAFQQIQNKLDEPYAIYGHSMGSWVAYLLVQKILEAQMPAPLHLFVSGSNAPSVERKKSPIYELPHNEFVEELKKFGGLPEELMANQELMEFFVPVLRKDFQAVESYKYEKRHPLDIPVTVMLGEQESIKPEEAMNWQKETTQAIQMINYPGHHFFIYDYDKEIVEMITNTLEKSHSELAQELTINAIKY